MHLLNELANSQASYRTIILSVSLEYMLSFIGLRPGQDWDGGDVIIFSFSSSLLLLRVDDVLYQLDLLLLPALRGRQQHLDEEGNKSGLPCASGI